MKGNRAMTIKALNIWNLTRKGRGEMEEKSGLSTPIDQNQGTAVARYHRDPQR